MRNEEKLPRIAILLAVYEPDMDYLRRQLLSLNAQTYPSLHLWLREDCSPTVPFDAIVRTVEECITAFPYTIARNERNRGSNVTFERLTREAEGELFAYCDQDDVWLPEKLTVLQETLSRNGSLLVCSDMYIIDRDGKKIADSITEIRRHHLFFSGEDLAPGFLTHNFVTGCTVLTDAKTAKAAVPFCPYMIHDHYLALYCAAHGRIDSVSRPLICYRQHGRNQTGLLSGVSDKESYCRVRIGGDLEKFAWLRENLPCDAALSERLARCLSWTELRQRYWREKRGGRELWRCRDCGKTITLFELLTVHLPEKLFAWVIALNRKNII